MGIPSQFQRITCLNMAALENTHAKSSPYLHLVCPDATNPSTHTALARQFPRLPRGGSYMASSVEVGPVLKKLLDELRGPDFVKLFSAKFGVNLASYPQMVTLRGFSRTDDGRPRTDPKNCIATVLLYPNERWEVEGGMLRVLRSSCIDDFSAEVPPTINNLVALRRSDHALHGYPSYAGKRQSIEVRWMRTTMAYRVAYVKMWQKALFFPPEKISSAD